MLMEGGREGAWAFPCSEIMDKEISLLKYLPLWNCSLKRGVKIDRKGRTARSNIDKVSTLLFPRSLK